MRPVTRDEILDYQTWMDERPARRPAVLAIKDARRVSLGEHLVFLFENHDTVWYQIQEMMRVEQIVRERDIQHEIDTYNELLGGPGELGSCLLIGVADPAERAVKLRDWRDLLPTLYAELPDGRRVRPTWDPRQVDPDRVSSVQYLKWDTGGQAPVALGCEHPDAALSGRVALSDGVREALSADLSGS